MACPRARPEEVSDAAVGGSRQTGRVSQGRHAWVLHVDLDQFIAAVEVLRHPELAGKPLIVGGRGDPTERAVVSTASYEARVFGVGSGMPLRIAARKAPEAVLARVMELVGRIEPGRPVRLLGLRAEMRMPDEAREGHTPTRSGW